MPRTDDNEKQKRRTAAGRVKVDIDVFVELFDEVNISFEGFRQKVKEIAGFDVGEKILERLYTGETESATQKAYNAIEKTLAKLLDREPDRVCIRKKPRHIQKSASLKLNEKQTENLLKLHVASVGYRVALVVQDTLQDISRDIKTFDEMEFYERIKGALWESRDLCRDFDSEKEIVGNMAEFVERAYPEKELKKDVSGAVVIITQEGIDVYHKWLKLHAIITKKQKALAQRLRERLREE